MTEIYKTEGVQEKKKEFMSKSVMRDTFNEVLNSHLDL